MACGGDSINIRISGKKVYFNGWDISRLVVSSSIENGVWLRLNLLCKISDLNAESEETIK